MRLSGILARVALALLLVASAFAGPHSEPYQWTDRSGTITLGGTAQTIAAVNGARTYLLVQNVSDTAMWVNLGATATAGAGSILLSANGGSFVAEASAIPLGHVSILCATTGKAYTAKEMTRP
jgi:hypothetical protein